MKFNIKSITDLYNKTKPLIDFMKSKINFKRTIFFCYMVVFLCNINCWADDVMISPHFGPVSKAKDDYFLDNSKADRYKSIMGIAPKIEEFRGIFSLFSYIIQNTIVKRGVVVFKAEKEDEKKEEKVDATIDEDAIKRAIDIFKDEKVLNVDLKTKLPEIKANDFRDEMQKLDTDFFKPDSNWSNDDLAKIAFYHILDSNNYKGQYMNKDGLFQLLNDEGNGVIDRLFIIGPTGTGKTESFKALKRYLQNKGEEGPGKNANPWLDPYLLELNSTTFTGTGSAGDDFMEVISQNLINSGYFEKQEAERKKLIIFFDEFDKVLLTFTKPASFLNTFLEELRALLTISKKKQGYFELKVPYKLPDKEKKKYKDQNGDPHKIQFKNIKFIFAGAMNAYQPYIQKILQQMYQNSGDQKNMLPYYVNESIVKFVSALADIQNQGTINDFLRFFDRFVLLRYPTENEYKEILKKAIEGVSEIFDKVLQISITEDDSYLNMVAKKAVKSKSNTRALFQELDKTIIKLLLNENFGKKGAIKLMVGKNNENDVKELYETEGEKVQASFESGDNIDGTMPSTVLEKLKIEFGKDNEKNMQEIFTALIYLNKIKRKYAKDIGKAVKMSHAFVLADSANSNHNEMINMIINEFNDNNMPIEKKKALNFTQVTPTGFEGQSAAESIKNSLNGKDGPKNVYKGEIKQDTLYVQEIIGYENFFAREGEDAFKKPVNNELLVEIEENPVMFIVYKRPEAIKALNYLGDNEALSALESLGSGWRGWESVYKKIGISDIKQEDIAKDILSNQDILGEQMGKLMGVPQEFIARFALIVLNEKVNDDGITKYRQIYNKNDRGKANKEGLDDKGLELEKSKYKTNIRHLFQLYALGAKEQEKRDYKKEITILKTMLEKLEEVQQQEKLSEKGKKLEEEINKLEESSSKIASEYLDLLSAIEKNLVGLQNKIAGINTTDNKFDYGMITYAGKLRAIYDRILFIIPSNKKAKDDKAKAALEGVEKAAYDLYEKYLLEIITNTINSWADKGITVKEGQWKVYQSDILNHFQNYKTMEKEKRVSDNDVKKIQQDMEKILDLIFKTQMIIVNILPIIKSEDQSDIHKFIRTLNDYEYIIKQRAKNITVTFRIKQ